MHLVKIAFPDAAVEARITTLLERINLPDRQVVTRVLFREGAARINVDMPHDIFPDRSTPEAVLSRIQELIHNRFPEAVSSCAVV